MGVYSFSKISLWFLCSLSNLYFPLPDLNPSYPIWTNLSLDSIIQSKHSLGQKRSTISTLAHKDHLKLCFCWFLSMEGYFFHLVYLIIVIYERRKAQKHLVCIHLHSMLFLSTLVWTMIFRRIFFLFSVNIFLNHFFTSHISNH